MKKQLIKLLKESVIKAYNALDSVIQTKSGFGKGDSNVLTKRCLVDVYKA